MFRTALVAIFILIASSLHAVEISGVKVEDNITIQNGTVLTLNGAGMRTKFFFDIYLAELYLEKPSTSVDEILSSDNYKRIIMHFLYSEVDRESLVEAWNEGFAANLSKEELTSLQNKIDVFNLMFDSGVTEGEQIILDYSPSSGTRVTIADVEKGVVEGKDFNSALLSIWIGKKPVAKDLRNRLLDYKSK